ncbi:MAG: RNA polymerase sigma factor [Gemmatimonadaceae bacterium]
MGEESLFRHLIAAHTRCLCGYVSRYTPDSDEIDDLVQEVWFQVYERRRQFRNRGSVKGWIFGICRSVCVTHSRRAGGAREAMRMMIASASSTSETSDALAKQILADTATDLVMALPARQRLTVICRVMLGMSTSETAHCMHCAAGTVKASLSQALRSLRAAAVDISPRPDENPPADVPPPTLSLASQAQVRRFLESSTYVGEESEGIRI